MLPCCSLLRRASRLDCGLCHIRGSHCVDHSRVPYQGSPVVPGDQSLAIRSLSIKSGKGPDGSLIAGVPALLRLRRMISFMLLCLACRPNPREHDRPCEPLAETGAPHPHVCGSHLADPSRSPTATLTASSLNLRLNVVSGMACSQSEACGAMEALRCARS